MLGLVRSLPFTVVMIAIGAFAMFLPAIHAAIRGNWAIGRAFLYSGLLFLILFALLAVVTRARPVRRPGRSQLLTLVAAYALLPAMLAVPFYEGLGTTRFMSAWFEMVSSLTTTGATMYDPQRLAPALHLWRATVGWMGGFLTWVTAVAIFAPLNLGGYEVVSGNEIGEGAVGASQITQVAGTSERLIRFSSELAPVYVGLTLVLWVGMILVGETPLNAVSHAMSTMSTSGITPAEGPAAGFGAEALVFVFLIFAVSRSTFSRDGVGAGTRRLIDDPEIRMGAAIVTIVPLLLFLRHWIGAFDVDEEANLAAGLQALWGGIFTTLSFLTTTGWESASFAAARDWSGLQTPGLVLMGLALFGGGVATTAGGVKLLRIYALYKHGLREMEKLVRPSSVGGAGSAARRMRRKGAYVAWIFFMLFALSIALVMTLLSLTGLEFEASVVLTIAALSTTGPLADLAGATPISYGSLTDTARMILAGAMILGRLETLALISLFNPDLWRN